MREGLFTDDDLNQLENGYSVSGSEDDRSNLAGMDPDIMSLASGLSANGGLMGLFSNPDMGANALPSGVDPNLAPFFAERHQGLLGGNGGNANFENRIRL